MKLDISATVVIRAKDLAELKPVEWGSFIKSHLDRAVQKLYASGSDTIELPAISTNDFHDDITIRIRAS